MADVRSLMAANLMDMDSSAIADLHFRCVDHPIGQVLDLNLQVPD